MGARRRRIGSRARVLRAVLALGLLLASLACRGPSEASELLLATTTSVRDSGLLDSLLPDFEANSGIRVRTVAVGSGAALRMAREGQVDAALTHAAEAEQRLLEDGSVISRLPVMQNFFVLVGPPGDPAGIAEAESAVEAYRRLARADARYVSRADDSGTHRRERRLMRDAGLDPERAWPGVLRTGSGMGATLQVAGERRAYTLSDLGTFLAFQERIELVALSQPEATLRNEYALLRVNAERFPRIQSRAAQAFEDFLRADSTREQIARFGRERFGRALFEPVAAAPDHG